MPLGEGREPVEDRGKFGGDEGEALAHLQNESGIDDVLRRRALVEGALEIAAADASAPP